MKSKMRYSLTLFSTLFFTKIIAGCCSGEDIHKCHFENCKYHPDFLKNLLKVEAEAHKTSDLQDKFLQFIFNLISSNELETLKNFHHIDVWVHWKNKNGVSHLAFAHLCNNEAIVELFESHLQSSKVAPVS
jgi:hypothetical protein